MPAISAAARAQGRTYTARVTEKPRSPVSMQKSSAPTPAQPKPDRPRTIVAMTALLVAAGLAAVGAAAALFGIRGFLYQSAIKNHSVLSSAQVHAQQSAFQGFLTRDLAQHPQLNDTATAARATDAQKFVTKSLTKVKTFGADDASSQATKMHDAVSSALGGLSGNAISAAQASTQATKLAATYRDNLNLFTYTQIRSNVNKAPKQYLIVNIVLLVALVFVASAVWRGTYWSRWAVIGLWVLSTFAGSFGGISSLFYVSASFPGTFKVPVVLAGFFFLAAVISAFLPASSRYYNQLRPAGAPQRRGLFAPRVPPPPRGGTTATPAASNGARPDTTSQAGTDRSKAKQRASAEAVAKGAELARSRAKAASKSRRTGS